MPIEYREYSWWGHVVETLPVEPHPDVYYFLHEYWPTDTPGLSVRHSVAFPDENTAVVKLMWGTIESFFKPKQFEEINTGQYLRLRRVSKNKLDRMLGKGILEFRWVPYTVVPRKKFSVRRRR